MNSSATPNQLGIGKLLAETWLVLGSKWPVLLIAWFMRELLTILAGGMTFLFLIDRHEIAVVGAFAARFVAFLFLQPLFLKLTLRLCRNKPLKVSELGYDASTLGYFAIAAILYYLCLLCGLVALMVPAIFFFVRCSLWSYLVVDEKFAPLQAMTESYRRTGAYAWSITGLSSLALLPFFMPFGNGYVECFFMVFLGVIYTHQETTAVPTLAPEEAGLEKANIEKIPAMRGRPSIFRLAPIFVCSALCCLVLLISIRQFIETRYIVARSMQPNLQQSDRVLLERSFCLGIKPFSRGEIIVFYPPPWECGYDLIQDPMHIMGRLSGLPFLPYEKVIISRIIGLPGEKVEIFSGRGVSINGRLLLEPYAKELPDYSLSTLADIGTDSSRSGNPYRDKTSPIIVPAGKLFVLGDNRNLSDDSHEFGFVDQDRVVSRLWLLYWPKIRWADVPSY